MHQQVLNVANPIEDARAAAISYRDKALVDRLDFMNGMFQPVQNVASLAGNQIGRVTGGVDRVASNLLLNPLNRTTGFIGMLEGRLLDITRNALKPTTHTSEA
ncbi:hypothetical protein GNI_068880 [Gregarina niphandrodes]|uniref:Uncharacterized protein n=1 Tax=Gregarina niphandrodes TaxID=110365 RepID=A0A023B7M2_GRENI|nr:hypothetical protein GNI_068880 [Gregarina niphandrodes]EZG67413.1 hypothetical protein GNI_068880 [Gregarina niphandrodes]|eukprot:XP_011130246.1 hypothetical protein GNI_068880 [Gregarina niphandrodes]